ncbi:Uncharacterised protein [Mycobacteroides abscessus subsp. massiliense]|uniref:hypothetical protein n=1 Tax=Mycobacteroides abscessus TaxID=36809 RepID=UPI0004B38041|nr:hypothetical protein [Mycobacteroides abscessus]SKG73633.1 Uncharacterised protein [Mycobacteroides abscessus subsp. massiliense]SKH72588.1 Uncharacterised protein [Mycobacteroides abscessus subsp. massiliense]SKI55511.1 Uncharacterised protein [Mycobacteroides abscessus subsp. massiliense]SKI76682.1 Uncharacterised protein [Mycobacteroides abscessus subsp. massiliense]SKL31780.1 Uncharacterised protein [Mycobacteroides abscessus subsp. massiliense]
MTGAADSRRLGPVNGSRGSIWTDGRTWIGLFLIGSVLLGWGILSLPLDGTVRAMMLFFAILVAAVGCGGGWLETMSSTPLPALDHTPRVARVREVVCQWEHPDTTEEEETRRIIVEYLGGDGRTHVAHLGDLIHESSIDQFTPESSWHVYAFADPELADTMVLLTEAHDDMWRSGYLITGLHGNTEFSSLQQPAAGSPFLNGKRRFVS